MIRTVEELKLARDAYQAKVAMREGQTIAEGKIRKHVLICGGTGCTSSGSAALRRALEAELAALQQKESSYKAQIAALEARVAQLSAPEDAPSMAERVTFYYREENGGAVITGYTGNTALLSIPATLDGLPVTAIGEHAFERASLTAVILPDSVVSIGWFAFYECQSLAGVTLPASVSTIGYAVFDGCPALTLRCPVGSYAEQYAKSYAIPYTNL